MTGPEQFFHDADHSLPQPNIRSRSPFPPSGNLSGKAKNPQTPPDRRRPPTHPPPPPPPPPQACRGRLLPAAGFRALGDRCGTTSPPGSPPSARRSSRCSAARSPPPPHPDPGKTQYPRLPPPSRPTSRRTGWPSTPPPARIPPRQSAPETGARPSSSPSSGSATSTPPSSPPFSDRSRPRRGSSPPPTESTAESAPPSPPSPTASGTPRRPSPRPSWSARPTWKRSWRSSKVLPSRPTGSVEAFLRSSSPPLGGTRRHSSSRLSRASFSPCTTRRCSAVSTSAAPRPASLGNTRRASNCRGSKETKSSRQFVSYLVARAGR